MNDRWIWLYADIFLFFTSNFFYKNYIKISSIFIVVDTSVLKQSGCIVAYMLICF